MAHVKICPSKVPAVELRVLCATVLDAVTAFYRDPENQRQFEEWQKSKEVNAQCLKQE